MKLIIFVFMAVFMAMVFLDIYFIINLLRLEPVLREKLYCAVALMSSGLFVLLADFLCADCCGIRLISDLILIATPFLTLINATYEESGRFKLLSLVFFSIECVFGLYFCSSALSVFPSVPLLFSRIYAFFAILSLFGVIFTGRVLKLTNIKNILMSSNMEDCLNSDLDNVYNSFLMLYAVFGASVPFMTSVFVNVIVGFVSVFLLLTLFALSVKVVKHNFFIFAAKSENRLLASTCVTPMDLAKEVSKDKFLKDVYLRVLALLNKESLYLNPDLTIKEVAEKIGSNKNYVSKAVLVNAGKNFSQFLNYYRVAHAVRLMQLDPRVRIGELYSNCGFNSHVTFAMAFRLYMKMTPMEWLKTERKSVPRYASRKGRPVRVNKNI